MRGRRPGLQRRSGKVLPTTGRLLNPLVNQVPLRPSGFWLAAPILMARYAANPAIATLTINRPRQRNALSYAM